MSEDMNAAITIPAGYRQDAKGNLVPESMIKDIDKLRDQLVMELIGKANAANETLADFKRRVFEDIRAFVDLSAEKYDVKLGSTKGNLTLHSFDGKFRVQIAIADRMQFDERIQVAKKLIDECILEWSEGSRDEIKALINLAFDTDREGKINVNKVLGLRRLNITDPKWLKAMNIIGDSVQAVSSKEYVRFYKRIGVSDRYSQIQLDVAAV